MENEIITTPRGKFRLVEATELVSMLGEKYGLYFHHEEKGEKYTIYGNGVRAVAISKQ